MKTTLTILSVLVLTGLLARAADGEKKTGTPTNEPPKKVEKAEPKREAKPAEDEAARKARWEARQKQQEQQRKELLDKYDTNRNGKLDREEVISARAALWSPGSRRNATNGVPAGKSATNTPAPPQAPPPAK